MKLPNIKKIEESIVHIDNKLKQQQKILSEAQDVFQYMEIYSKYFPNSVVQCALALITTRKKASLAEIIDYFELNRKEAKEIEIAIDYKQLNFIHTTRTNNDLSKSYGNNVLFSWDCPRLWQEYQQGNTWFRREMIDAECGKIRYIDENGKRTAECPYCHKKNIKSEENDLCEHFYKIDTDKEWFIFHQPVVDYSK